MLDKIREKILGFVNSNKDVPVLAGLSIGLYMLLFYYSKNFSLANSLQQLLFFIGYYLLVPMLILYGGYKIMGLTRFAKYRSSFVFLAMACLFAFYLLQLLQIGQIKRLYFGIIIVVAAMLAYKVPRYYKLLTILLLLMSTFNLYQVGKVVAVMQSASDEWRQQPDDIYQVIFKESPNIYYIQPDGYANANNLKSPRYNFDNSDFDAFLNASGFKTYEDFRSNYYSTLLSNSSMFAMKHHYTPEYMDPYGAREVIISKNPVLKILKNNNYRTHLFTERPYLIINRPQMGYDYCNFTYSELPHFMDGWDMYRDIYPDLAAKIKNNGNSGNFYFIESFMPGHIANSEAFSNGVDGERINYLTRLKEANNFLKKTIDLINRSDSKALIVIAADHGGFAGFSNMDEPLELVKNNELAQSMFGAHLSIKWNRDDFKQYDEKLKSSVNIFRTVFSYLAQDKKYLEHLQENSSYIRLSKPEGLYRYIDNSGKPVFKRADELQD